MEWYYCYDINNDGCSHLLCVTPKATFVDPEASPSLAKALVFFALRISASVCTIYLESAVPFFSLWACVFFVCLAEVLVELRSLHPPKAHQSPQATQDTSGREKLWLIIIYVQINNGCCCHDFASPSFSSSLFFNRNHNAKWNTSTVAWWLSAIRTEKFL